MRIQPNETYEEWTARVCKFEHEYALRQIADGADIDSVMEYMSKRIMQKLLHPVLVAIKSTPVEVDIAANRKTYEETYLRHNKPKSDHVED